MRWLLPQYELGDPQRAIVHPHAAAGLCIQREHPARIACNVDHPADSERVEHRRRIDVEVARRFTLGLLDLGRQIDEWPPFGAIDGIVGGDVTIRERRVDTVAGDERASIARDLQPECRRAVLGPAQLSGRGSTATTVSLALTT